MLILCEGGFGILFYPLLGKLIQPITFIHALNTLEHYLITVLEYKNWTCIIMVIAHYFPYSVHVFLYSIQILEYTGQIKFCVLKCFQ